MQAMLRPFFGETEPRPPPHTHNNHSSNYQNSFHSPLPNHMMACPPPYPTNMVDCRPSHPHQYNNSFTCPQTNFEFYPNSYSNSYSNSSDNNYVNEYDGNHRYPRNQQRRQPNFKKRNINFKSNFTSNKKISNFTLIHSNEHDTNPEDKSSRKYVLKKHLKKKKPKQRKERHISENIETVSLEPSIMKAAFACMLKTIHEFGSENINFEDKFKPDIDFDHFQIQSKENFFPSVVSATEKTTEIENLKIPSQNLKVNHKKDNFDKLYQTESYHKTRDHSTNKKVCNSGAFLSINSETSEDEVTGLVNLADFQYLDSKSIRNHAVAQEPKSKYVDTSKVKFENTLKQIETENTLKSKNLVYEDKSTDVEADSLQINTADSILEFEKSVKDRLIGKNMQTIIPQKKELNKNNNNNIILYLNKVQNKCLKGHSLNALKSRINLRTLTWTCYCAKCKIDYVIKLSDIDKVA